MGLLGNVKTKHNHNKCQKVWTKVYNIIKYQDTCVITMPTKSGFEEFFQKITDSHLDYTIKDSGEGFAVVTITKPRDFKVAYLLP